MRPNTVKRLLKEGKPAFGAWLNIASMDSAEIMANVGFDWLVVDSEHSPIDYGTLRAMFIAIGSTGTIPLCRVPANDPVLVKRALDAGSYGCVIPMVNSVEEAENAVRYCKYPLEGIRSAGPGRWRFYGGSDYMKHANDEVLVIAQIEHIDAVNRCEEIMSVPGVDIFHMGPGDLAWSMGKGKGLGEKDPEVIEAIAHVLDVGKKLGVNVGSISRSLDEGPLLAERGYRFIALQNDVSYLLNGASNALKVARGGA